MSQPRRSAAMGWRTFAASWLVYSICLCVVTAWRAESSSDFRDFWRTGVELRQAGALRSDLGVHNYLPFFTIFMSPWSALPLRVAIVLFTLFSMALALLTFLMIEILIADRIHPAGPTRAGLVALLLVLPYLHSGAVLGTVGALLTFLIVAAWLLLKRGHAVGAGAALGLATLIKLLPAALIVLCAVTGRWRAALAAAIVVAGLGLALPVARLGWTEAVEQHREFYQRALVSGSAHATLSAEKPQKAKFTNNALPIVLRRLLSPVDADPQPERGGFFVNFATLPRAVIEGIYWTLLSLLMLATIAATICRRDKPGPPALGHALIGPGDALLGAWCCLMLLASPLVWTHYLILTWWPLAVLASRVVDAPKAFRTQCLTVRLAAVGWVVAIALLAWPAARACGAQIAAVVLLWAAMLILAVDQGPAPSVSDSNRDRMSA